VDTALIVFGIGTITSFVPMYWIASRLMGRRRTPAKVDATLSLSGGDPAGRGEFMQLLRREAGNRAVAVLRNALIEVRLAAHETFGDRLALSARTRQSLDETRRLVDSLFPTDLREAFGRGLETLASATSESIGTATATTAAVIAAFEQALEDGPARPARGPSDISFWRAIRDKGRGWIGAGDVGVAA
jgi:hypothetical protein